MPIEGAEAEVERVRIAVEMTPQERQAHALGVRPFRELRRAHLERSPDASEEEVVRALGGTPAGRRALLGFAVAHELAVLPGEKRRRIREILAAHASERVVVVGSTRNLVAVVASGAPPCEREAILARYRTGALRTVVDDPSGSRTTIEITVEGVRVYELVTVDTGEPASRRSEALAPQSCAASPAPASGPALESSGIA